jgi:hypothetical protein
MFTDTWMQTLLEFMINFASEAIEPFVDTLDKFRDDDLVKICMTQVKDGTNFSAYMVTKFANNPAYLEKILSTILRLKKHEEGAFFLGKMLAARDEHDWNLLALVAISKAPSKILGKLLRFV